MTRWTTSDVAALSTKRAATAPKPPAETANRITANIIRAVNMRPGCVAYRVNHTGIRDEAKGVFRKSHMQKGIADISAIFRGRSAWIEVKAGRDKLSPEQLIFKQEVERAGGLYFEARSTDSFLEWFTEILKNTNP